MSIYIYLYLEIIRVDKIILFYFSRQLQNLDLKKT